MPDCRKLLTEDGCMTVNLFGRSSSYAQSLEKIEAAFGAGSVWAFKPTREGNTIVLALRAPQQPNRATLAERAETIETRWGLPARKWLRVFKPAKPDHPIHERRRQTPAARPRASITGRWIGAAWSNG